MINFEKFTNYSQEIVFAANAKKDFYKNTEVQPEHIVLAMIEDKGIARDYLEELKLLNQHFINEIIAKIKSFPTISTPSNSQQVFLSRETNSLFEIAFQEAETLKDEFVGIECLLIAMTKLEGSFIQELLKKQSVSTTTILNAMKKIRGNKKVDNKNAEGNLKALQKYSTDLTALAKKGKLDPVIGRDEEIRRVIQVLNRRTKNNPVLIGEPGVGKTAIIEGLAQRIIRGDVPESLKEVTLISLDLGALVAGAKFRGEFEERLKAVLKEVQDSNGEIVMFIDELHTVVGAGSTEGSMDAGNLLKPMLARGELRTIGATTINEYRKYIEKDPALERRFQPVLVDEPSVEDTISILRGLKEKYEVHHGIRILDSALIQAAKLSDRYITDRFLPDKAIDLIDEAASALRIQIDSMPEEIDTMFRQKIQLEVEREALKKETSPECIAKIEKLTNEINSLDEKITTLKTQWEIEKNTISGEAGIKEQIDKVKIQIAEAERNTDLQKAAELKYGKLMELEKKLQAVQGKEKSENQLLKEEINGDDIANIVSKWTGIPVTKLVESEMQKLLSMEDVLHKRLIGQEEAVDTVSDSIRRARSGLKDPKRPIGTFIFLGPTGVGKTELAKTLAEFLFNDEDAIVRIDMSEYMEKHNVSRLVGAPPGYVGYEEGGQLTEAVRRKPYSVVLFDEIEKAHPDVFNIMLQIFDDGRLTDSKGKTIDFKNTVIIMTSNIGSEIILEDSLNASLNGANFEETKEKVNAVMREKFKPEFLNRVDETIFFKALTLQQLSAIVDIQMDNLRNLLKEHNMSCEITEDAKEFLATRGFNPIYGARPLKRVIRQLVENPLSKLILAQKFIDGDTIKIDLINDELVFEKV
ncbi:MAG: ATP-dependent chaperone ClpB [Cyanobacteria bacterium SIG28]|nr:ATP-dependent chaperone ClpB [Cyanobacteria bacterium SIG28]